MIIENSSLGKEAIMDNLSSVHRRRELRYHTFLLMRSCREFSFGIRASVPSTEKLAALVAAIGDEVPQAELAQAREVIDVVDRLAAAEDWQPDKGLPPASEGEQDALDRMITRRRSVRFWTDEPVAENDLEAVLAAGLLAPSGCNQQPVRFVLAPPESTTFAKIMKVCPHKTIKRAPMTVLVAVDQSGLTGEGGTFLDAGAAIQNMLLKAHALGYGACWMGQVRLQDPALHDALGLPLEVAIVSAVLLGRLAEAPPAPVRMRLVDAILNTSA
jgi:nitroreductase